MGATNLLAVVLVCGGPEPTQVDTEPPDHGLVLIWDGPEGCGSAEAVREVVPQYASDWSEQNVDGVEVRVQVNPDESSLVVEAGAGSTVVRREVALRECAVVVDVAGVVVAVALDQLTMEAEAERASVAPTDPEPEQTSPPKPEPEPAPEPAPPPEPSPPPAGRPGGAVGISGVFEAGGLPRGGLGVGALVALRIRRARLELAGTYLAPRHATPFTDAAAAGARISAGAVALRGCFVLASAPVELTTCVTAEGGAMRARGIGLETGRTVHDGWASLGALAGVGWAPVPRFAVRLAVEGLGTVYRPRFLVDDLGEVHEAGNASVRLLLSPEVRF